MEGIKKATVKWQFLLVVSAGGLEPPTLCLKGRCSTPELRALKNLSAKYIEHEFFIQIIEII